MHVSKILKLPKLVPTSKHSHEHGFHVMTILVLTYLLHMYDVAISV
jgi:hypothetical protein